MGRVNNLDKAGHPQRPDDDGHAAKTDLWYTEQLDQLLEAAVAGPKGDASAQGIVTEGGRRLVQLSDVTKAIVGKMRLAGFSLFDIFSVLARIGMFFAEHGDDIEAIWKDIIGLFPGRSLEQPAS